MNFKKLFISTLFIGSIFQACQIFSMEYIIEGKEEEKKKKKLPAFFEKEFKEVPINEEVRSAIEKFLSQACSISIPEPDEKYKYIEIKNKLIEHLNQKFPYFFKKIKKTFPNIPKNVAKEIFKEYLIYNIDIKYFGFMSTKKDAPPLSKLSMCECPDANRETRLYLILDFLNNLFKMDRKKKLDFVSIGSGGLLMEYLTLKGIIKLEFKNIHVFVIDPGYSLKKSAKQESLSFLKENKIGLNAETALKSFKEIFKENEAIKEIKPYLTYFDFLEDWPWEKKDAEIIQIIDPGTALGMHCKRGIEFNEYANYVNSATISIGIYEKIKHKLKDIIAYFDIVLPYKGIPFLLYKKNEVPKYIENFLLIYLKKTKYKGYKNKKEFINNLTSQLEKEIKEHKNKIKIGQGEFLDIGVSGNHNSELGFYEIIKNIASKKPLIYYLDNNKIYQGVVNIRLKKQKIKVLK